MVTRVLDRIEQKDEASRAYGVAKVVEAVPTRSVWWTGGPVLDQGEDGHCGGFAGAGEAAASPVRVRGVNNAYGHRYYYDIKDARLDPFGREEGTSILAVMKLGQRRGLWGGYHWAFSLDDLKRALKVGPVILGVPWMTGCMEPNSDGIIRATGIEEGGHALIVTGWSPRYGRRGKYGSTYRLRQSWGRQHGRAGNVYLPEPDMHTLLIGGRGEAGVPVTRQYPTAP